MGWGVRQALRTLEYTWKMAFQCQDFGRSVENDAREE